MTLLSTLRILCALAVVCDASAFDLVRGGEASAVIVTPENPLPVVEYAAREFRDHVQKSSGVELDIVSEEAVPDDARAKIFIGSGKAAAEAALHTEGLINNGFWVASTENALFLLGKDGPGNPPKDDAAPLGTLFAVYQWLDSQLGVRWLWPGETGTFIPKRSEITEPGSRRDTHTPALLHSRLRYANGHVFGHWKDVLSPEEWDKFVNDTATWLRRHRFARNTSLEYGHGYTKYWKRFGAEHPDWFAQQPGGKRGPIDNATELVQLCVSNPGLQNQILKDWQTQRKTRPSLPWINGIENDRRRATARNAGHGTSRPRRQARAEVCFSWIPKRPANPRWRTDGSPTAMRASGWSCWPRERRSTRMPPSSAMPMPITANRRFKQSSTKM